MTSYSLRHLPDDSLSVGLDTSAVDDRLANATVLAHIAEFDRRRLYLPTRYPSMFRYCVGHLRMSEDIAFKRVRAARVARMFPGVFDAIAEGRLNLSGVTLLARHLTRANGRELLAAAVNRSRAEIQEMLARRFPMTGSPASPATASPAADATQPAGPMAEAPMPADPSAGLLAGAAGTFAQKPQQFAQAPGPVENAGVFRGPAPNSLPERQVRVRPVAPGRYELVAILDQETHDRLMGSRELLGHVIPSGALIDVLQRAIALQHEHLRKSRCGAADRPRTSPSASGSNSQPRTSADGATDRPRTSATGATERPRTSPNGAAPSSTTNPRHVPRAVRRVVWERNGGRCTFVSTDGHRCEERGSLELDHVVPVARGGASTVENLRLLCSAHNRHAAERFHRQAERERLEQRKAEIERQREEFGEAFRNLGYRGRDLEIALAYCAARPEAPLEERLRYALGCLAPASARRILPGANVAA